MKLLRCILAGLFLLSSVWIASYYWAEASKFAAIEETKRIAEVARLDAEALPLRVKQTELLVFFATKNDYPVEKFGCPLPEVWRPVKQKNGKIKREKVC